MNDNNIDVAKPLGHFSAMNTYYTYSYINNGQFYSLIPSPYFDYYQRFIRHYFYWYDGFVPYFHTPEAGMFATRLAYSILHKLAEKTTGGQLMFDDEGEKDIHSIKIKNKKLNSLEFTEHWAKENALSSKITQGTEFAFVGGDSVIKLDSNGKDLRPSVLRKDNYFVSTDFAGNISNFTGFIYEYNQTVTLTDKKENVYFYLLEERNYDDNHKPQIRYFMKRGTGNMVSNKSMDMKLETVPFDALPRNVRHSLKRDFANIELGEFSELPLKDLGVYMLKASEKVSFLPSMVGGESLLSNLLPLLMSYDFYYSSLNTSMYTARDKVIMPQHMQQPNGGGQFGANFNHGFDSYIMTTVPYADPQSQKPIVLQFDLRANDWEKIRNILLQTVATNLGISERDIATYLVPSAEKPTAREISSDENATALFIENKRRLLKTPINDMLEAVLDFYGFNEEIVTVRFSRLGLSNISNVVQQVTVLKQNGLIDDKTALEMVFVDKNNKQIENMLDKITLEKEQTMELNSINDNKSIEDKVKEENNTDIAQVKKDKKSIFNRGNKKKE